MTQDSSRNNHSLLPDLVLPSLANQHRQFLGMDTLNRCLDRDRFLSYPHQIDYRFNSRGFRGPEWPTSMSDLQDAIWCIGDSFTVGIGAPLSHTWPFRLGNIMYDQMALNVSLAGAGNEWIADTAERIVAEVNPRHMVIMWSLTRRRQNADTSLSPEDRRLPYSNSTDDEDWQLFLQCKKRVDAVINAVHFAIPDFHAFGMAHVTRIWNNIRGPDWPENPPTFMEELHQLPAHILHEIEAVHGSMDQICQVINPQVIRTQQLDRSRDGHHFGLMSAEWIAEQAADRLSQ